MKTLKISYFFLKLSNFTKSIFLIFVMLLGASSVNAQKVVILNTDVKDQIVDHFKNFEGIVTQSKIDDLLVGLKSLSTDLNIMCYTNLFHHNKCIENADTVYYRVNGYIDDLIDKTVEVNLVKFKQPWLDENFYVLRFKINYLDRHNNSLIRKNFDTIVLDIDNDKIINVIYAREWIDLDTYGK
jgi:hypothetical protein